MTEKFFEFNSEAFLDFLSSKGFKKIENSGEIVYARSHDKFPFLKIKIYTTISGTSVRRSGSDAIRIVAIFDNGQRNFGIGKFPRIYRRAPEHLSIEEKNKFLFERVLLRLREAYARCNQWLKEKDLKQCT